MPGAVFPSLQEGVPCRSTVMISALTRKLIQSPSIILEENSCLRRRLRTCSCRRCVDACPSQALTDDSGKVSFNPHKCTSCGVCVASCPGDAFSFDGFTLNQLLEEQANKESLVISCCRSRCVAENELRLPCVGAMTPESLLFLGLSLNGEVQFNLAECRECENRPAADFFVQLFQHVQRQAGYLFRARLMLVCSGDELPDDAAGDRRTFLFSLGTSVAEAVKGQFAVEPAQHRKAVKGKRQTARTQLIRTILTREPEIQGELIKLCTPEAQVSRSCTHCPRCKAICPTGALKIEKDGTGKLLSYDRTLCTACGLCVTFCKEKAICIREADFVPADPHAGRRIISSE